VDQANNNGGKDNISVIIARAPAALEDGALYDMIALTDVGVTRSHNEDAVAIDAGAGLAVLADGMGGYNAGEVASDLAVRTVMLEMGAGALDGGEAIDPDSVPDLDHMLWGDAEFEAEPATGANEADDGGATDEFPALDVDAAGDAEDEVEEIVIHAVGESPDGPVEDAHTATARALKVGSWVEFDQFNGKHQRARLTWISQATGSYLFTNRQGLKVVDTTPQGLAVEFRRGTARPMADVPLFDRAVSSLMDRLKKDAADPWQ
ncbi:MAG: DUF1631 family protein, partial [Gammaproteobacteria bacterium]